MKIEKKPIFGVFLCVFWFIYGTFMKIYQFGEKKIFEIWGILIIFSKKNPLYRTKSYFSS